MSQDNRFAPANNPYAAPNAVPGTPGYGAQQGVAYAGGEYEFGGNENALLERLASAMKFVGIFCLVLGVLGSLGGVIQLLTQGPRMLAGLLASIAILLQGIWTTNAAASFRNVVQTSGNDIGNLMAACRELRKTFMVIAIGAVISLLGIALTFAFGPAPTTMHHASPDTNITLPSQ